MFLFEPVSSKSGCKYKEHQVSMATTNNKLKPWLNSSQEVYNELITNQIASLVCEDDDRTNKEQATQFSLEVMMKTESSRLNTNVSVASKEEKRDKRRPSSNHRRQRTPHSKNRNKTGFPIRRKENGKHEDEEEGEEEEEDGSDLDEPGIVRIVIQHKDSPTRAKNSSAAKTWNTELPTRLNQDLQRESDVKRMNDLINRLSVSKPPSTHNTQQMGLRDKTSFDGGLYCQIEHKLKALLLQQQASLHSTVSSSNFSTKTSKNK